MNIEDKLIELKQAVQKISDQISMLESVRNSDSDSDIVLHTSFQVKRFDVSGVGFELERTEYFTGFVRMRLSEVPFSIQETHILERGRGSDLYKVVIYNRDLEDSLRKKIIEKFSNDDSLSDDGALCDEDILVSSCYISTGRDMSGRLVMVMEQLNEQLEQ